MTRKIKVAAAQLAPVFFDRDATTQKACEAIVEAGRKGAQLIAFPETFLPGYPYFALYLAPTRIGSYQQRLYEQAVELDSETTAALAAAAREAGCVVVMGINEREGGTLYNSQLFIGADGAILGCRRKLVPTSHERLVWGRGDGSDIQLYDTAVGKLGALICYEHVNPLFRYAVQAQGEQVHVANWPGGMASINDIMDAACRHYAFEGQCFVLSVTSVLTEAAIAGLDEELRVHLSVGGGYSMVISPRGKLLVGPLTEGEGILYADLDFADIDRIKAIVDGAGHYARPDVMRLQLDARKRRPLEIEE
ncbi:MAG: carbon-nitrogen hydrolase family protein [Myxococcales bacterium]|nr:carbon-nitrogen hydrolase family protein [Myxococcales bacterium]